MKPLKHDFDRFIKVCEERTEVCKYLGICLHIVGLMKNIVASDREGNWDLHSATVEDSIPVFGEFDCLRYFRNGGYYSEKIKALEFTDSWLFRRFKLGLWVIQEKPGKFRAVSGDMKMEQGLQCVSKGPGGHYVVGQSGNAAAVAEFELLFPEVGKIARLLSDLITGSSSQHLESNIQSCFNQTRRNIFNDNVCKLLSFISARQNVYIITATTPIPLHNILNDHKIDPMIAQRVLNCLKEGEKEWKERRQIIYVDKKR